MRSVQSTRRIWYAHLFQDGRTTERVVLYLPDGEEPDEKHAVALSAII